MFPMAVEISSFVTFSLFIVQVISEIPPLRCCTLVEEPFVIPDPAEYLGYTGLALDYLVRLQARTSFKCQDGIKTFKGGNNVGFTEFVYHLEQCSSNGTVKEDPSCNCDIAIAGFALSTERIGRVDYLPAFVSDSNGALIHKSNLVPTDGNAFFFNSFSTLVWISIFALIIAFTVLKMLDARFANIRKQNNYMKQNETSWVMKRKRICLKRPTLYRLRFALDSVLFRMVGQPSQGIPGDHHSTRQRMLNFIMSLVALFLILVFEATITATLLLPDHAAEFRGVEDFKNCRIPPEDVCIPHGGAVEAFWNEVIAPSTRDRCRGGHSPARTFTTYTDLVEAIVNGTCKHAVAGKSLLTWAERSMHCEEVVLVGKPFMDSGLSFVLPKGSPYTEELSRATLALKEHDSIPTVEEYISRKLPECNSVSNRPVLAFERLQVFFYLAFAAVGLLFLEMVLDPQNVPEQQQKETIDIENREISEERNNQDGSASNSNDYNNKNQNETDPSINENGIIQV